MVMMLSHNDKLAWVRTRGVWLFGKQYFQLFVWLCGERETIGHLKDESKKFSSLKIDLLRDRSKF